MQTRSAKTNDADAISELMEQLGYETTTELIRAKLVEFSKDPLDEVFVAELQGSIVGFVSCHVTSLFHQAGTLGRITSLLVDDQSQGQGVGGELLSAAEAFFRSNGCVRSEVTSGDHRSAAHNFYRSNGFVEDERRFVKAYT